MCGGVATDTDGNVSVVGETSGALGGPNKGLVDAWVIKFDGEGDVLWKRQPGTSDTDRARGVVTDKDGNVSVVGDTDGALGGPHKGFVDAWVIKFDGEGDVLWKRQPGTSCLILRSALPRTSIATSPSWAGPTVRSAAPTKEFPTLG